MNKASLAQLWVFVIGFLFANLHKRSFDPMFRVLIALPIGWALFGICATMIYSVYFSAASQLVLLVAVALGTLALLFTNIRQRSLSRDSILLGGASLVALTAVCLFVNSLRIVTVGPDSSYLARFGQNIGLGNYEGSRMIFSKWGPFVPFMHSVTNLLDEKLFWQYQPIISLNLVAIVFYTIYTTIRAQKSFLQTFVATTVLISLMTLSDIFVFHFFYIHTMIISGLYIYLFVFALAKMQQQPGRAYELVALLSLIAFGLARIEAPLFLIVILLITSFRQGWSYINRLKLIIPFVVFFVAWYARVYFILPEVPDNLTKGFAVALISVLVGFGVFAVVSGFKVLDPIVKRTPFLTVIGLFLVGIVFTIIKPEHMLTSLVNIVVSLSLSGNWGLTWYVILFLATELYFTRRDATEHRWLFLILVSFMLVVYDLVYFREPYHTREFDSANRLVLEAVPLVFMYLSLRFAQISFSQNAQSSQQMGDRNSSISIPQPDSALRHTALS
jgi:hypothetical protein